MEIKFDYIIYGTSLSGCLLAIKKANAGARVLLVNNFGFPGGLITESLSCFQTVKNLKSELLQNLFSSIKNDSYGILYEKNYNFILNPESVKFHLQGAIEKSEIVTLFHATPVKIKQEQNQTFLTLLLREGQKDFQYNKLIDASDNYYLFNSIDVGALECQQSVISLIIAKPIDDKFIKFKYLSDIVRLKDGRYWISMKINPAKKTEIEFHRILVKFSKVLLESRSRIQLLPADYHSIYRKFKNPYSHLFTVKKEYAEKDYYFNKIFFEADQILLNGKI